MVSFFGRKLGSDKKKAQAKAVSEKEQRSQKWDQRGQEALADGRYFGQNFSRPHLPASAARPRTANAPGNDSDANWGVFKNPALTASMVDLTHAGQGQSDLGNVRHAASDMNLVRGITLPTPLSGAGHRPRTPDGPISNGKMEWMNPLSVHVCKYPAIVHPGSTDGPNAAPAPARALIASATPPSPASTKNFLGPLDFGLSAGGPESRSPMAASAPPTHKPDETVVLKHGYPSPPQSDKSSERALSPVTVVALEKTVSADRHAASSSTGKMGIPGVGSIPSPAPSGQRTSEDRPGGPIIRNVPARHDAMAFHQPRRRSFTMEFEAGQRETAMHPKLEVGFSGNFADFDFGGIGTANSISGPESQEGKSSVDSSSPHSISSEAAKESKQSLHDQTLNTQSAREQVKPPGPAQSLEDQATTSALIDQLPSPPGEVFRQLAGPVHVATATATATTAATATAAATAALQAISSGNGNVIGSRKGFQSRFDESKSSRAPPPRPLRPAAAICSESRNESSPKSPFVPLSGSGRSHVQAEDPPPSRPARKTPCSPFFQPMEGDFPVSKGLPRGRTPGPPAPPKVSSDGINQEDEANASTSAAWSGFEKSEPRRSAIPAPLTSAGLSGTDMGVPTPSSATAPRIPSPTFPSLVQSISSSSSTFGKPFEIDFDEVLNSPLFGGPSAVDKQTSDKTGTATATPTGSIRFEAQKAPPRPAPITLPPSVTKDGSVSPGKSPFIPDYSATFI